MRRALRWVRDDGALTLVLAAALLVGFAARLLVGWDKPLWFDEVYTATFAVNPTASGLLKDVLSDVNGVLYYTMIWAWVHIAGASDTALRIPSLLFSIAAPLMILRWGHPDRTVRLTWAGLSAVFVPLLLHSAEARCYPTLFFFACVQAIVFRRLLGSPTLRLAFAWTSVSTVMVLLHYFAVPLVAVQGLAIVLLLRQRVFLLWPAILGFVPLAMWVPIHISPLLMNFGPGRAWQSLLTFTPDTLVWVSNDLVGLGRVSVIVLIGLALAFAIDIANARLRHRPAPYSARDLAVVLTSLLACASLIVLGFLSPSYTERYVIVNLPGLLFGMALCAHRLSRVSRWAAFVPSVLLLVYGAAAAHYAVDGVRAPPRTLRGEWEGASNDLHARGARRVTFVWGLDQPSALAPADPELGARLGGFFLDRARSGITVVATDLGPLRQHSQDDVAILTALGKKLSQPHDAFLWRYDRDKRGPELSDEEGYRYAAEITHADCRDYSDLTSDHAVIGCLRTAGTPAPR